MHSQSKIAIIDATDQGSWEYVGGIPLVARNLFYVVKNGIKKIIIFAPRVQRHVNLKRWASDAEVKYAIEDPLKDISQIGQEILYIDSSFLFDQRIIDKVANCKANSVFIKDQKSKKKLILALLNKEGINIWKKQGVNRLLERSNKIYLTDIEPFSEEMRGEIPPYVIEVRNKEDAKKATWTLIKSMQKKVMDLPAEYLDPIFEDRITFILCYTPVTPNMVTFFSLTIAVLIAFLFYSGHFLIAALCTYIVEVLDGVDGKLARTKLEFSKFGEYECLVDYFYENLWYISIGLGLKNKSHYPPALILSAIMVLCDTLDNIVYTLSSKWFQKNFDLLSQFEKNFRKIAGRRNIYCFMFIIGFFLGYYIETFFATTVWAAITCLVHIFRLLWHKRKLV